MLGNQYLLKVTSLTLSTVIAVEVSALLVKRQGRCNFKINAAVLKLGLDVKRGYKKFLPGSSAQLFFLTQLVRIPVG